MGLNFKVAELDLLNPLTTPKGRLTVPFTVVPETLKTDKILINLKTSNLL